MSAESAGFASRVGRHPRAAMAVGALGVSASSVFIELSGTSPGTASFFRCVLALPLLWPLCGLERRREGAADRRSRLVAAAAGVLFAGDALLWTQAIYEVGAGLSTVLVNAQVLIVPLLALMVDGEAVGRRFWVLLPVMTAGILLTGGVFESGRDVQHPVAGTVHAILAAMCYSGFLFLLRRGAGQGRVVHLYRDVVIAAALVSLIAGWVWQGVTVVPGWRAAGWLALTSVVGQVVGWLLVALAGPRLHATVGAVLLLLTPVGSLALAAAVLNERPTPAQLGGCALVLAAAVAATVRVRRENRQTDQ